ncbi:MAG: ketoacyl-ACP synthase III [Halobacteriovoraceae bacterium]|jgi:3-oxoacyl-[acyl-carrier-protein] synthase III|nr:ketoacyl-ACP synthase III [Halobacteriovoraceae bacterium]
MSSNYGIGIIGVGHDLPEHIDTNEELCKSLDEVTPEWILEKTGIQRRYIAQEGETASQFSVNAAKRAMVMAGITPDQVGLIIACTFSADYIFPPLSAKIHHDLGTKNAQIFDIQANCSGFVTGLTVASDRMMQDDSVAYALVVGVELHTRYIDRSDVNTSIFFSDGAGAAVLAQVPKENGVIASSFHADTSTYESVRFRGGGSSFANMGREFDPKIDYMEMNGLATWKQAITGLPRVVKDVLKKSNLTADDVNLFLFHQANLKLIEYVVKKMKQPLTKTYTNVQDIGNTGAASIAIVLSDAVEKGLLKDNDILVLAGVGAGFNFGASTWRWHGKV